MGSDQFTNKFSLITILNWDSYQSNEDANDHQNDQQIDQQATSKRPANDHIQEHKNKRTLRIKDMPPTEEAVRDFFKDDIMASKFLFHYQANGWVQGNKDKPIVDWRAAARGWKSRQGMFSKNENNGLLTKPQTHLSNSIKRMEDKNDIRDIQIPNNNPIICIPEQKD